MKDLVIIPKGVIRMRDDRTSNEWIQSIESFLICEYPVTRKDFNCNIDDSTNYPVTDISWFDAIEYCNKQSVLEKLTPFYEFNRMTYDVIEKKDANGYRLPSEAEWEYACRAGSNDYTYGPLDDIAWTNKNSYNQLHEVGLKEPNAWGLYDMLGNVWEWCNDIYDINRYGIYRTFRGGSWADNPRASGASCRRRSHPTVNLEDLGFRMCKSL